MGRGYRKLIAWQKADELIMKIYQVTKTFPKEEIYGLVSQLRRSALSVPTNIAEGMARKTEKDKAHFLVQAEASLSETGYLLEVAHRLGYLPAKSFSHLTELQEETAKVLYGLTRQLERAHELTAYSL